jgi:excisionase family DNA binding protein
MKDKLQLVTASEAARRLGIHPKSLGRLFRKGKIDGIKLANRWLIEEATLEMFSKDYVSKKGRPKGYRPGRRQK